MRRVYPESGGLSGRAGGGAPGAATYAPGAGVDASAFAVGEAPADIGDALGNVRGRALVIDAMALDLDALEVSFDLVAARGDELVEEFYRRLFATAPAVKPLFGGTDMRRQRAMLLAALVLLRKSLRDLDAIVPKLRDLGARHVAYGAQPGHYPVVGQVLITSMAAVAGEAWRPHYERAWADAFEIVAGAMLEGAAATELQNAA